MVLNLPRRAKNVLALGGVVCSVVGGVVLWKDSLAGNTYANKDNKSKKLVKKSYEDRVFIVTGANSGIGEAITWELARLKGKVYMACRDMKKCEEARREIVLGTRNKYVYCRECDLASLKSIRQFAKQFLEKESRLDVLINNAGVMNHPRQFTADGFEMHLAVNTLGPFLLTDLLSDILTKTDQSRIVNLINLDYRKGNINFEDLVRIQQCI